MSCTNWSPNVQQHFKLVFPVKLIFQGAASKELFVILTPLRQTELLGKRKERNSREGTVEQQGVQLLLQWSDTRYTWHLTGGDQKNISLKVRLLCAHAIILPLLSRVGVLASFELTLTIICHQQFYKLIRKNSLINEWLAIKWQSWKKKPRVLSFHYHQLRPNYKQIIYVFCCGLQLKEMALIKRENMLIN